MSRQTHDLVNDHFGVLTDAQIADGTPADGDVPINNGDGTSTWGPQSGGGSLHLANDDTSFTDDGVRFTSTADYLGAFGGTAVTDGSLLLDVDLVELNAQTDSGAVSADFLGDGTNGKFYITTVPGGVVFVPQDEPPAPDEGETYYDATLHQMLTWDGSAWQPLGGASGGNSFSFFMGG